MRKTYAVTAVGLAAVALTAVVALRPPAAGNPVVPVKNDKTANLIVNGSFETGPAVEGSYLPVDEDSVAIRGWVVTRGQIDLLQETDGKVKAAHGKRCLDLHGSPGRGGVEQPLVTKAGQKYKVTFSMAGNLLDGHIAQLAVRAAGKKEIIECDLTGQTPDDLKWQTKTWEFTAVDPLTVLEFRTAMMTANPFGGPLLDDVKVVAAE